MTFNLVSITTDINRTSLAYYLTYVTIYYQYTVPSTTVYYIIYT